jgi:glycosyltransferase involved in cell wall biosynthesis
MIPQRRQRALALVTDDFRRPRGAATDDRRATVQPPPRPLVRPRLLLLAQTLPFPPDGGVNIRIFNVLRLLAREYEVTLLCFVRRAELRNEGAVATALAGLAPFAEVKVFPIPQEESRLRYVWDHLRSVITGKAYVWYAYESAPFRDALEAAVRARMFEVVQIDSLDLACYLPALSDYPVVCVHHNVESALLERRALMEANPIKRWYLGFQARLVARMEQAWCGRVALNVAVSDPDLALLRTQAPNGRYVTVPNGVNLTEFRPVRRRQSGIVSTGGLNWFPNADALTHFRNDILPRVRALLPTTTVRWVGRADRAEITACWEADRVELTGYVDDVRPFVQEAAVFVVPLRVGGGTRLKILDAWAMGKAVVSTSVGCEGLEAEDERNILIRDDPESFALAVASVLADPRRRERLGAAGRRTVERVYDWEVIGTVLQRSLDELPRRPFPTPVLAR